MYIFISFCIVIGFEVCHFLNDEILINLILLIIRIIKIKFCASGYICATPFYSFEIKIVIYNYWFDKQNVCKL